MISTERTARTSIAQLPVEPGFEGLEEPFASAVDPTPLPDPQVVVYNAVFGRELGFDEAIADDPAFIKLIAGNARFRGIPSVASAYAGHQFGQWAGRLGDGRAISLGNVRTPDGTTYEWQLKGAGLTPFSRFGDGRAVLRSTIREYLASEALHALGIPTTRALAIAGSPEPVYRETEETAAVLSRLAPSHLRFGHFEWYASSGRTDELRTLADVAIAHHFPELASEVDPYAALVREVARRTGRLVAQWMAAGFAHGVLNTDNMSLLGLTLDYGPYGWLEAYDPGFICNHTDHAGRYAFGAQPSIGLWNVRALGTALEGLSTPAAMTAAVNAYAGAYNAAYPALLHAKFGLPGDPADSDVALFTEAFELLRDDRVDYTRFFRLLGTLERRAGPADAELGTWFAAPDRLAIWLARYRERIATGPADDVRRAGMEAVNPCYVLRNHLAQHAIERAEAGDYSEIARLSDVLAFPYRERPGLNNYAEPRPPDVPEVAVSCSS